MVMKVDLVVTVTDQGSASANKVMVEVAGYITGSERRRRLTLSMEPEDEGVELQSLPRNGESGTRRYEGGKARSKKRQGGGPVYVIAG